MAIGQACQERVFRAAACADANDAAALAECFAEDAVLLRPNAEPLEGRAAIRAAYQQRPVDRMTRHLVTNLLVEVESPERARARSYVLLWAGSTGDAPTPSGRPAQARQMVGEFEDRFVRTAEGRWLIERREARFTLYRDG